MQGLDHSPTLPTGGSVFPRASLVAINVLFGVEWQIRLRWNVPVWSVFVALFLTIALDVQVVVARFQEPPRPLRPLTLTSLAVAVLCTVLVVLSTVPSDRWFLLAWLVPASLALAERTWPDLPSATLVRIVTCLLALVIVGQVWFIWRAHTRHEQARGFRDQLAQICADTAARTGDTTPAWIAANEWMLAQLASLTPPDQRSRELTGYLANALHASEAYLNTNDPGEQRQWQQLARETARDLGIGPSCGVF